MLPKWSTEYLSFMRCSTQEAWHLQIWLPLSPFHLLYRFLLDIDTWTCGGVSNDTSTPFVSDGRNRGRRKMGLPVIRCPGFADADAAVIATG